MIDLIQQLWMILIQFLQSIENFFEPFNPLSAKVKKVGVWEKKK